MSLRASDLVWDYSLASGGARLVLLALARFADKDSLTAYPGVSTLARITGLSVRQVQRALRKVEQSGEIQVVQRGGAGRRSSTTYRITIRESETVNCGAPFHEVKGDMGDTLSQPLKGDISGIDRVTFQPSKGDIPGALGCHPCHPNRIEPKRTDSEPSKSRELSHRKDSARFARDEHDNPDDTLWGDLCRELGNWEMTRNGALWDKRRNTNRQALLTALETWKMKTPDEKAEGGGKAGKFITCVYENECAKRAAIINGASVEAR